MAAGPTLCTKTFKLNNGENSAMSGYHVDSFKINIAPQN